MNSRAGVDIKDCNLCNELFGPVRVFDVEMAAGNMREELYNGHDQLRQKPVGIIENHPERWQKWRRKHGKKRDRQNEKRNRHDDQIRHQRNRCDDVEIPKYQWQRTEPCGERNTSSAAKPIETGMQPTARTPQQASWQERIGRGPALQKSGKWIGEQYDGANDRELELKDYRKKINRAPQQETA